MVVVIYRFAASENPLLDNIETISENRFEKSLFFGSVAVFLVTFCENPLKNITYIM